MSCNTGRTRACRWKALYVESSSSRTQVGSGREQCPDCVVLHRRIDLVRTEFRILEERGQRAYGTLADVEAVEDTGQVLERRLRRAAPQAVGGERALHLRVRGDDRPPR